MADAGFFRGTSAEQDNRFSNKDKKLMKEMKFADSLNKKVDMTKVRLEVVKPWVTEKITAILGIEDDVVIEYVFNQLEAEKQVMPKGYWSIETEAPHPCTTRTTFNPRIGSRPPPDWSHVYGTGHCYFNRFFLAGV